MLFELDNVELNFGERKILKAVYLKAETGKITGILGRNGAGKSSLLRIIFGSLKPKYKLLRVDKKPWLKKGFRTGKIKFLPQTIFLPKYLFLPKIFMLFQVDWESFLADFEHFKKYEHSKIGILSGGETRLVQAYLILKSPSELVLLDEPFSHIAPIYVEKLKEILSEEKKHKAIILTDQLFREIIEVSDEIYVLKEGVLKSIPMDEIDSMEHAIYFS